MDSSNLPTNDMESSKQASSNLPIYKKEQPFLVPSAISNQPLRARNKIMSGQNTMKKENIKSSTNQKSNFGNITKENIYEMDAYSDVELGYTAPGPTNKKKNKRQANKRQVKKTGEYFI